MTTLIDTIRRIMISRINESSCEESWSSLWGKGNGGVLGYGELTVERMRAVSQWPVRTSHTLSLMLPAIASTFLMALYPLFPFLIYFLPVYYLPAAPSADHLSCILYEITCHTP